MAVEELTPRQRAFLDKLIEICRENRAPVHYSDVAARLGVNPFTAYDMLKLLEKKGFVRSSYALSASHSGPGRSLVMFAPTSHASASAWTLSESLPAQSPQPATEAAPAVQSARAAEDWAGLRERLLRKLREARGANPREALNDLLARLPEARGPLTYCTEMVGILLLNMQRALWGRLPPGSLSPFRALAALQTTEGAGLEALAGLSLGATLSADDETSPSLTQRLLDQARRYQANLSKLSSEARSALAQFLGEALAALD